MTGSAMAAPFWLIILSIGLIAWVLNDLRQYRVFKEVADSAVRRRFYLSWAAQNFVLLGCGSLVTALVLGRYLPLLTLPPEFEQFAAGLSPPEGVDQSEEGRLGLVIGLVIGLAIAISLQVWRMRRASKALLGDVDAMIPRNWLERLAVLPLCLSAGFSEELFFRLALPLLLATITGSVMVGFAASTIIFGLIHAYQGWKGMVATTLAGAFFTYVYLRTGSLIRPILLHALLDVVALIVRPVLASWLAGKHRSSSPDTCNVA